MRLFKLDDTRWFHVMALCIGLILCYFFIKYMGRDRHVAPAKNEIIEIKLILPPELQYVDLNQEYKYVDNT